GCRSSAPCICSSSALPFPITTRSSRYRTTGGDSRICPDTSSVAIQHGGRGRVYDAPMAGVPPVAGAPAAPARTGPTGLLSGFGLGALIALGFGAYARVHAPSGETVVVLFFSGQIQLKVWLATVAVTLAVLQLGSALWMYGKIGRSPAPAWLGDAHKLMGTLA